MILIVSHGNQIPLLAVRVQDPVKSSWSSLGPYRDEICSCPRICLDGCLCLQVRLVPASAIRVSCIGSDSNMFPSEPAISVDKKILPEQLPAVFCNSATQDFAASNDSCKQLDSVG